MLDRLEFLVSEALVSLRRNTWMTFAAISTATLALFLLGGLGYAYLRLSSYVRNVTEKFEIAVFMIDGFDRGDVDAVSSKISEIEGVKSLEFVPKEVGGERFLEDNPDLDVGSYGLDPEEIFPDRFDVQVDSLDEAQSVAARLDSIAEVRQDGVSYADINLDLAMQTLAFLRWLAIGIGGLMLVTCGVLIYNAIRMTIVARRREIRIMELVGASRATVAVPLLFEGVLQGFVGGAIATLLLIFAHGTIASLVASMSNQAQVPAFPVLSTLLILSGAGAIYGLICSAISVRAPRGQ